MSVIYAYSLCKFLIYTIYHYTGMHDYYFCYRLKCCPKLHANTVPVSVQKGFCVRLKGLKIIVAPMCA